MKIINITHQLIRMPFSEEIVWGSGRRSGATRLLCKITTAEGIIGWGETICLIDTVPAVFEKIVAPLALGYEVSDVEKFYAHILGAGYYHHKRAAVMAIAAMEMAMWDAFGKSTKMPLWKLWGGRWREKVSGAAYLFTQDPQALERKIKCFLDAGFTTFKIKIGFDLESDLLLMETTRSLVDKGEIRGDVNGAWTPGTARRQLNRMHHLNLQYIEQPLNLDDLLGHKKLRQLTPIPIALDESAYTLQDVGNIVRLDAADVVLLDPHEAGGLWQTIKAAAICESVGIPVTLHSGGELALSQSAYLHLAASIPNMSLAIDTESTYLADDVSKNKIVLKDGFFQVPEEPGLGVEIDEAKLKEYEVSSIEGAYLDKNRPGWFPVKPSY